MAHLLKGVATGAVIGAILGKALQLKRRVRGAENFDLDPRLMDGKLWVCDLRLCRVLVVDDAAYPCWLVLVPRFNHITEVTQLLAAERQAMWEEVAAAARIIQDLYRPFKLNIAAIGNIVSQLHVHVTGRLQSDPAWPGPCYGVSGPKMEEQQAAGVVQLLKEAFSKARL